MSGIAIVDTHVVVAALTTRDDASPVARTLAAMLRAEVRCAVSMALLAEYREVLSRSRIRRIHRLSAGEIDEVLVQIARHAVVVAAASGPPAPDPGDQLLWDLLAARAEFYLVTGDAALRRSPDWSGRVLSPREFVDAFLPDARQLEEPGARDRGWGARTPAVGLSRTSRRSPAPPSPSGPSRSR